MTDGTIHLFDRLPQVDDHPDAEDFARYVAAPPARARPLVGMIRNARSHHNTQRKLRREDLEGVLLREPSNRDELPAILAEMASAQVDYIVMDGGDGTVRDVLTCGAGVFGDSWPTLVVLPHGKTNALAYDLGIPGDWSLSEAQAAIARGKLVRRQPLVITQRDNTRAQVRGCVLGAGAFIRAIALGQRGHDLGAFNGVVVGLTAVWSAVQALFGGEGNAWRRGTPMVLRHADGREVDHRGGLPANQRYLLFASTLQRFPAGLNPFRGIADAMRVAIFDNAARSLVLRLVSVFRGRASGATRARGFHVFGSQALDIDIGDNFILDGEAFPPGQYRMSAGAKLRFVIP